jgi:hypothetical protein
MSFSLNNAHFPNQLEQINLCNQYGSTLKESGGNLACDCKVSERLPRLAYTYPLLWSAREVAELARRYGSVRAPDDHKLKTASGI